MLGDIQRKGQWDRWGTAFLAAQTTTGGKTHSVWSPATNMGRTPNTSLMDEIKSHTDIKKEGSKLADQLSTHHGVHLHVPCADQTDAPGRPTKTRWLTLRIAILREKREDNHTASMPSSVTIAGWNIICGLAGRGKGIPINSMVSDDEPAHPVGTAINLPENVAPNLHPHWMHGTTTRGNNRIPHTPRAEGGVPAVTHDVFGILRTATART